MENVLLISEKQLPSTSIEAIALFQFMRLVSECGPGAVRISDYTQTVAFYLTVVTSGAPAPAKE